MNRERPVPYPYQETGADFLARRPAGLLADGPGLGKTIQAALAAQQTKPNDVLVITPATAVPNWHREWGLWGPPCDLEVISFEKSIREPKRRHDLVIVDESHYCKTRGAQRTRSALGLAKLARYRWLLSGTPYKHPGDLWPMMYALFPGVLKQLGISTYEQWFNRFCKWTLTQYGPRVYDVQNLHELNPFLKRLMLRRLLPDVGIQLPPLRVDLSLLPRSTDFTKALREFGANVADLERRIQYEKAHDCGACRGLGTVWGEDCTKCDGSGVVEGSRSRLRRLVGEFTAPHVAGIIAQELEDDEYHKIVVMAHHRSVLDLLERKFDRFGVVRLDGSTSARKKQYAIDEFTESAHIRVFLAQQTAAGIAINLQVSSEIVLVEPDWDPDKNAQAILRIHRIGSKYPCRARLFAAAGTIHEGVMRVAANKIRMQVEQGLLKQGEAA